MATSKTQEQKDFNVILNNSRIKAKTEKEFRKDEKLNKAFNVYIKNKCAVEKYLEYPTDAPIELYDLLNYLYMHDDIYEIEATQEDTSLDQTCSIPDFYTKNDVRKAMYKLLKIKAIELSDEFIDNQYLEIDIGDYKTIKNQSYQLVDKIDEFHKMMHTTNNIKTFIISMFGTYDSRKKSTYIKKLTCLIEDLESINSDTTQIKYILNFISNYQFHQVFVYQVKILFSLKLPKINNYNIADKIIKNYIK